MLGNIDFMPLEFQNNEEVKGLHDSITRLCSEISLQRSLTQKKDVKYTLRKARSIIGEIKKEVALLSKGNSAALNVWNAGAI